MPPLQSYKVGYQQRQYSCRFWMRIHRGRRQAGYKVNRSRSASGVRHGWPFDPPWASAVRFRCGRNATRLIQLLPHRPDAVRYNRSTSVTSCWLIRRCSSGVCTVCYLLQSNCQRRLLSSKCWEKTAIFVRWSVKGVKQIYWQLRQLQALSLSAGSDVRLVDHELSRRHWAAAAQQRR